MEKNCPIALGELAELTRAACDTVFRSQHVYEHDSTKTWNTSVINTVLSQLVSISSSGSNPSAYKFFVTSTIIQNAITSRTQSSGTSTAVNAESGDGTNRPSTSGGQGSGGKRGMHSASGAFWNKEKDGCWSYKYDASEMRDFDVVVSVVWIATT